MALHTESRPTGGTCAVQMCDDDVRQAGSVEDCERLLEAGSHALEVTGDLRAARNYFDKAYRAAVGLGSEGAMAAAALGLGGLWVHEHRSITALTSMEHAVRRALTAADPRSALSVRLRARLAAESDYRSGDHSAILAVLEQARRLGDPLAEAEALSLAHHCLLGPDHGGLRRELAQQLIQASSRTGRRTDQLMGLLWLTVDLFLDGDTHAERRLDELRANLAATTHLAVGFVVSGIEVMLSIQAGTFDQAETLATICRERGTLAGDIDATGWYSGQLLAIRWYQGRLPELIPALEQMVSSSSLSAVDNSLRAALAVAAALAGDKLRAASALAALTGSDLADLPRSSTWLVTMNGVVEAAFLLKDCNTSARAYDLLLPFAHLPMIASLGAVSFGSVQHALGVACLGKGDLDSAVTHLRAAVQANLALSHWPAVLTSRHRYAQALRARGGAADLADAREAIAIMGAEGQSLGMTPPSSAVAASVSSEPLAEPTSVSCTRYGHHWRVEWGHRQTLVGHCVGMIHLNFLLANPGVEIAAIELATRLPGDSGHADSASPSAQPVLDRAAVQSYRRRLEALRDDIQDAETRSDDAHLAKARAEYDWLVADLAAGTGLSGRVRSFTDNGERARLAVGKAIRRALDRIEQADPIICAHLRGAVQTGRHCSYRPPPADTKMLGFGASVNPVASVSTGS